MLTKYSEKEDAITELSFISGKTVSGCNVRMFLWSETVVLYRFKIHILTFFKKKPPFWPFSQENWRIDTDLRMLFYRNPGQISSFYALDVWPILCCALIIKPRCISIYFNRLWIKGGMVVQCSPYFGFVFDNGGFDIRIKING